MIFLFKHLDEIYVPEDVFLYEIKNKKCNWFVAKKQDENRLNFVKNKSNASFFLSKLKNFPFISSFINNSIPNAIIENSYITKCEPGYEMEKHIDKNRRTAIIMPLGKNKGVLNYYYKKLKIASCVYRGPILSKVDVLHSAKNTSDEVRYSVTVELEGDYLKNYFLYK